MDSDTPITDRAPPIVHGEVERIKTPLGELELGAVLRDAHTHVFGEPPTRTMLATAWAQCGFEHGWGRHIDCHNIGNITAGKSWPGDYFVIKFTRKENPHDAPKGDSPTFTMKFRAHLDFIDGARNYWHLLATQYSPVLQLFEAGNAYGAGLKLKTLRYYTANEVVYSRGMASLYNHAVGHVLPQL